MTELKKDVMARKEYALLVKKLNELKKLIKEKIEEFKPKVADMKVKAEEMIKNAKAIIKQKVDLAKKELPALVAKAKKEFPIIVAKVKLAIIKKYQQPLEMIKITIAKLEKKMTELKKDVMARKEYALLVKKLNELKKHIDGKIAEFKRNPTVLKIKSKGEEMLLKIKLMKKKVPVMIAKAKLMLKENYENAVKYVKATIAKLETKFGELKKTVMTRDEYIVLVKKLNQLKDMIKNKVEQLKNNPTLLKYKKQLIDMANKILKEIKERLAELRHDLMVSYEANKNLTLRFYQDCKAVATDYYNKGKEMCSTLKKDAIVLAGQVKEVSRKTYMKAVEIYNDIAESSFDDICKKVVVHGRTMVTSLKTQCVSAYGKYKPITEEYIKHTIAVLKREGLNLEKELKSYYESLIVAYEKVKSGVPVKEALKPVMQQILGKFDIKDIDIRSTVCKKDPELCKLVSKSWNIHKTLLKKYAEKIGRKHN